MLKIENTTYKHNNNAGYSNVSLELKQGETIAIMGPNGSGKTTLIQSILGALAPQKGQITFFNAQSIDKHRVAVLNRIGYVAGEQWLDPQRTGKQHLDMWESHFIYMNRSLADSLIARFNLDIHSKLQTYSRGQQILFQFVLALSHSPELLILDEATTGLDVTARQDVLGLLAEYNDAPNRATLMITHHPDEALRLANRVAFFKDGIIRIDASLDHICSQTYLTNEASTTGQLLGTSAQGHYVILNPDAPMGDSTLATFEEVCYAFCNQNGNTQ